MQQSIEVADPVPSTTGEQTRVRGLVGLSAAFLAVQVALTDFGPAQAPAAVLWFAIGAVLLWFVYRRRSRVARGFVVVTSLVGAVVFTIGALSATGGPAHPGLLALCYLGQALPLLSGPVRRHVQSGT